MMFRIFLVLGIINLILMMRTDIKTMKIDSRYNRFMLGAATLMFLSNYPGIAVMVGIFIMTITFAFMVKAGSAIGDAEMGSWAVLGFGTLNIVWAFIYMVYFLILKAIYMIPMKRMNIERLPGTPIFLASFILTAVTGYFLDVAAFGFF